MKPLVILALAVALEAGFLFTAAVPAPALARAEAAVKSKVVALARAVPSVFSGRPSGFSGKA